ncbi:MAG TPA: MerR family transcriptional regulator [Planococcus sp. (in: firmicutes)]|nr:MerR family transcriptional regulator [Planococcus sp. (in: firmicutes)]
MYKVQEVAKIAGVSVRTLHHYDSIGLLKPSNIGSNRYRYYNDEDLKLLQHILFFKELGFSLKKIQEIVAHGFDANFALAQHIEFLRLKKERIESLVQSAEMTLLENAGVETLSNEERFTAFADKKNGDDISKYKMEIPELLEDEVLEDDFEAAEEAEVLVNMAVIDEAATIEEPVHIETAKPEKEEEDLDEINREGNRIYNAVAALMHLPAVAQEVQIEMMAYYTLLNRFYDCTPRMFRGLADLYASDSRFANNIDQHGEGLSTYLKEAMYVYAAALQDA